MPVPQWIRDWDWWGNLFYLIGSIGYAILDFSAGWCSDNPLPKVIPDDAIGVLWLAMSIVFVIDALLYGIGWFTYAWKYSKETNTPIPLEARFWAEFYNLACSLGYIVLACLPYQLSDDPSLGETISFSMENVGVTMICVTLFAVDALLYFAAWRGDYLWEVQQAGPNVVHRRNKRCRFCLKVPFWAEVFNVIPSLIYVAGTVQVFMTYMHMLAYLPGEPPAENPDTPDIQLRLQAICNGTHRIGDEADSPLSNLFPPDPQQEARDFRARFGDADNLSSRWFFFGDMLFILDSILYMIAWYQDQGGDDDEDDFSGGNTLSTRESSINSAFQRLGDEYANFPDRVTLAIDHESDTDPAEGSSNPDQRITTLK